MLEIAFTIKYIGKSVYYRNALERAFAIEMHWKELLL